MQGGVCQLMRPGRIRDEIGVDWGEISLTESRKTTREHEGAPYTFSTTYPLYPQSLILSPHQHGPNQSTFPLIHQEITGCRASVDPTSPEPAKLAYIPGILGSQVTAGDDSSQTL